MEDRKLKHWRSIERMSVEQAGLLMAGVDPFDRASAQPADIARGLAYDTAISQASNRAWAFAHGVVHQLDRRPVDPATPDIWEMSGDLDRYLPSIEIRYSVAAVLRDPENVRLLIPVNHWYSETIGGSELNRWIAANDIESKFEFQDYHEVVIKDRQPVSIDDLFEDEEHELGDRASPDASTAKAGWPWGAHETSLLRKLAGAAERFWVNYDPTDPTTAPTNAEVVSWLRAQGVAERNAEVMATLLRVDGLPTGPRK